MIESSNIPAHPILLIQKFNLSRRGEVTITAIWRKAFPDLSHYYTPTVKRGPYVNWGASDEAASQPISLFYGDGRLCTRCDVASINCNPAEERILLTIAGEWDKNSFQLLNTTKFAVVGVVNEIPSDPYSLNGRAYPDVIPFDSIQTIPPHPIFSIEKITPNKDGTTTVLTTSGKFFSNMPHYYAPGNKAFNRYTWNRSSSGEGVYHRVSLFDQSQQQRLTADVTAVEVRPNAAVLFTLDGGWDLSLRKTLRSLVIGETDVLPTDEASLTGRTTTIIWEDGSTVHVCPNCGSTDIIVDPHFAPISGKEKAVRFAAGVMVGGVIGMSIANGGNRAQFPRTCKKCRQGF